MKGLITTVGFVLLFACQAFAGEHSAFFMTVRILTPDAKQAKVASAEDPGSSPPNIASNRRVDLGTAQ